MAYRIMSPPSMVISFIHQLQASLLHHRLQGRMFATKVTDQYLGQQAMSKPWKKVPLYFQLFCSLPIFSCTTGKTMLVAGENTRFFLQRCWSFWLGCFSMHKMRINYLLGLCKRALEETSCWKVCANALKEKWSR